MPQAELDVVLAALAGKPAVTAPRELSPEMRELLRGLGYLAEDEAGDGVDKDCDGRDGLPGDDESETEPDGCGCSVAPPPAWIALAFPLLVVLRRRASTQDYEGREGEQVVAGVS